MKAICAISAPYPGVLQVLKHGEKLGLWSLSVIGPDGSLALPAADIYLFGAWHPAYGEIAALLPPASQIGVLWTSSSGEVGFEPSEQESLHAILREKRISFVWFGHKPLADVFPEKGFYAPYPYAIPEPLPDPKPAGDHITLFCPATVKKNLFNQLCAAAILWRDHKFRLVTNVPVPAVLRDRLPSLQTHDWLPERQYHDVIAGARVNLACSWAETNNYQSLTAAIIHGVPSAGTATIPWLRGMLAVPNDPECIAEIACLAMGDRESQRQDALAWARASNERLVKTLKERLG